MTAPLFNVKSRFSEYVTMAENGEVVEITKYGRTTAVIISIDDYKKLKENYRPSFVEKLKEWRKNNGGLTEEEYADFSKSLTRSKETYSTSEALF